ncbi:transglutaminase-like protein [Gordonia spumicola]|uniref:Transglutaminase-like protein n=1 Tax=Gordonia spumicola TaxID=589161 RepID=A0A7I9V6K8_9ACTN|nr:transglutaminase family protein [Gordonia spumicola]GEE01005.1 transglutaminase-like protein [Gordonia spumicola]
MTARLRIVHTTGFSYTAPVSSSYNEARLTPRSDIRQNVVASHIETSPSVRQYRYTDYWGTTVTAFDVHTAHDRLEVTGTTVVETEAQTPAVETVDWAGLTDAAIVDGLDEMLGATAYTPFAPELTVFAGRITEGLSPAESVDAVIAAVHAEISYRPGSTGVYSTALDAWERRAGVCQDYAHITLAMVRSLGIPARYVSGYLLPKGDAAVGETVVGESHAWIETWTGEWRGVDPTNATGIGRHHVTVGIGRDYADVTPVKGIVTGGGSSGLDVSVRITLLA